MMEEKLQNTIIIKLVKLFLYESSAVLIWGEEVDNGQSVSVIN